MSMNFQPHDEFSFRLAVFLKEMDTPLMSKLDRLRESERLLLVLNHRYPSSGQLDAELGDLYYRCAKYASALAHLMRAYLKSYPIDPEVITTYHKRLLKESIDLSEDSHGGYILGSVLVQYGLFDRGTALMEQALEFGRDKTWAGFAALDLADAYRGKNDNLHQKFLKLASDLNNPEILRPHKSSKGSV